MSQILIISSLFSAFGQAAKCAVLSSCGNTELALLTHCFHNPTPPPKRKINNDPTAGIVKEADALHEKKNARKAFLTHIQRQGWS